MKHDFEDEAPTRVIPDAGLSLSRTITGGSGPVSDAWRRQTLTSERPTRAMAPMSIARSRAITEELK